MCWIIWSGYGTWFSFSNPSCFKNPVMLVRGPFLVPGSVGALAFLGSVCHVYDQSSRALPGSVGAGAGPGHGVQRLVVVEYVCAAVVAFTSERELQSLVASERSVGLRVAGVRLS